MLANLILALGLVLTASSQLRIGSAPLGPGEFCLLAWVTMTLAREVASGGPRLNFAMVQLLVFWGAFTLAECLGTLVGLMSGERYEPSLFFHDVMAYPLIAGVSCLAVAGAAPGLRLRRVAWNFVILGAGSLALQLANGSGLIDVPGVQPWFWERFRGWSANPNQLALLCVVLALVSLHLADTARRSGSRMAALLCAVLPIYIGLLTRSDTFTLTLFVAFGIYSIFKIRFWMPSLARQPNLRSAFAQIAVVGCPLLLMTTLPFAYSVGSEAQRTALNLSKNNASGAAEEVDLRVGLWQQALARGFGSAMLGLGPGPHLDIPAAVVAGRSSTIDQPGNIDHPSQDGTPNFEAHNTLLDLFTQGGLLGVMAFLWLSVLAFRRAYEARSAGLVTLLCGAVLFGMTGLIVRQPVFWLAIALCLAAERPGGWRSPTSFGGEPDISLSLRSGHRL